MGKLTLLGVFFGLVCLGVLELLAGCSKHDSNISTQETLNSVLSSKRPTEKLDLNGLNTAMFHSSSLNKDFTVRFSIFTGENCPNGYVIIKQIKVGDEVYNIDNVSPEAYVENIHTEKFKINGISLKDENTLVVFRTAEALVCAYYELNVPINVVTEDKVYATGRKMFGRKFGFPSATKLR